MVIGLRVTLSLLLLVSIMVACESPGEPGTGPTSVGAPLTGVDGSADQADVDCTIVLRSMQRVANATGGYVSQEGHWVWRAVIDVSDAAVAEGLLPAVLYQNGGDGSWRSQDAVRGAGQGGFTQFTADVWDGMPMEGMSGTALRTTLVRVVPFLRLAQGGRRFDHNRIADVLGCYEIRGDSGLQVGPDATVCPPVLPTVHEQRTTDATVTRVANAQGVCFLHQPEGHTCSGNDIIDLKQCAMISSQEWGANFDCTRIYEDTYQLPLMRPLVVSAYKVEGSQREIYGDYFAQTGYFVKRVEVAIREPALAAASFAGLGFYLDVVQYAYYQPVPEPGPATTPSFVGAASLAPTGPKVTLKDGAAATILQFALPITASQGGSSMVEGVYFRPYAQFEAGGDVYRNYDVVERDYFVSFSTAFDRSSDVIR